jgi:hypothetical protein
MKLDLCKVLEKGNDDKHDAQLRSKVFMQRKEINYDKTFSHVTIL